MMTIKKHREAVPRAMVGIIERSGRLRSITAIDAHLPNPACRLRLHTGL